jgi:cold shock CspA family protein
VGLRGIITNINYGRGCGFIQPEESEAAREVYFERDDVTGIAFTELHFGETVIYALREETPPPAQLRAATVAPTGA